MPTVASLCLINVLESILPSRGGTQRSLLFGGMIHTLSTTGTSGWNKFFWLLQYFSRCLEAAKKLQLPQALLVSEIEMASQKYLSVQSGKEPVST